MRSLTASISRLPSNSFHGLKRVSEILESPFEVLWVALKEVFLKSKPVTDTGKE